MIRFFPRTSSKHWLIILSFMVFYILWNLFIVGWRTDHTFFVILVSSFFFLTNFTRTISLSFVFFIIFWILYDSLRVIPNYLFNEVNILQPYNMEKFAFGIQTAKGILTPNEYFDVYNNVTFDILSGIFYLSWIPVPLMFGLFLMMKKPIYVIEFGCTFLIVNLLGFILYYTYPAAPPWYFAKYGNTVQLDIPGNAANLLRFDNLIGFDLFANIYTKNSNVFGAIPSLHSAYPIITLYYSLKYGPKWMSIFFATVMIGIWFAAVYSFHHYVIDVLLGIICAVFAVFLFEKLISKSIFFAKFRTFAKFIERSDLP